MDKTLVILGIRGLPAAHGGFETFAEFLAAYLLKHGWKVVVYCQGTGIGPIVEDVWNGVNRITIPVQREGAIGTIIFDWLSIRDAVSRKYTRILTLGYNTAMFCLWLRMYGATNVINMDGLEWKRDKWRLHEKLWLWANERIGCLVGNHLVADHPEIANHLATRVNRSKITMIPYGANQVDQANKGVLAGFDVTENHFVTVIARPEPENSVLEIVQAFSEKTRSMKLLVLGKYDVSSNEYHRRVMDAASAEVVFAGAIYDRDIVESLRFHSRLYVHGHRVGGTNPSLVEALGAGSAILAHDNHFNRWVAGDQAACYFSDTASCCRAFDSLLVDDDRIQRMKMGSRQRYLSEFMWDQVLSQYEGLLVDQFSR